MDKNKEIRIFFRIMLVALIFFTGAFISMSLSFNFGNEVVTTKVLDEVCHEIYGIDYYWEEYETGTDTKIVCSIKEIDDNRLIIKK